MNGFPEWEQLVDTDYQPISEKYCHEYTYYDDGSFLMTEYAPDGKPTIAKLFNADSICTDETLYDENGEFSVRQHYEISADGKFVITEYDRNGSFIRKYEL